MGNLFFLRYNALMSNNPRFLDLFNHLDESCRERYHIEDRTSSAISFLSAKLAHSSSKKDNDLAEALDAIRQLRNTLVHASKIVNSNDHLERCRLSF